MPATKAQAAAWAAWVSAAAVACSPSAPEAKVPIPYTQDFGGPLGPEWSSRGGQWEVVEGRLFNDGAHNVPLWLLAPLPDDVEITFTAESQSPAVDIKVELFGDGSQHASGYVVILSGWDNTKSIIARLDEHGPERSPAAAKRIVEEARADPEGAKSRHTGSRDIVARRHSGKPGHSYRMRVERRGGLLRLYVDDALHLEYFDPAPLGGPGHDRFAFNNWASKVFFDDLRIVGL